MQDLKSQLTHLLLQFRDENYILMNLNSESLIEIVSQYYQLHYWEQQYVGSIGYIFSRCDQVDVCKYIAHNYLEILYTDLSDMHTIIYKHWKMHIIKEVHEKNKNTVFNILSDFLIPDIIEILWQYTVDFKKDFPYGKITTIGNTQYLKID